MHKGLSERRSATDGMASKDEPSPSLFANCFQGEVVGGTEGELVGRALEDSTTTGWVALGRCQARPISGS